VAAAELNSQQIISSTEAGAYKPDDYIELWRSDPIPVDPIVVHGISIRPSKARLTNVLQNLDFSSLPAAISRTWATVASFHRPTPPTTGSAIWCTCSTSILSKLEN